METSIQPCALLLLVGSDWRITAVSANAAMIGGQRPADLIGQPLADLIGSKAIHSLRNRMSWLSKVESEVHDFGALTGFDRFGLTDLKGATIVSAGRKEVQLPSNVDAKMAAPTILADVDAEPVAMVGEISAAKIARASFRAPDDDTRERLSGARIAAAMTLPLRIDGKPVAAVHAYHGEPRRCSAERRSVAHLFAERLVARMARQGWKS